MPTASTKPGAGSVVGLAGVERARERGRDAERRHDRAPDGPREAGARASAVAWEIATSAAARRTAVPSVRRSMTVERRLGRIEGSKVTMS